MNRTEWEAMPMGPDNNEVGIMAKYQHPCQLGLLFH